ncbi:hypothetical protein BGZ81_003231, partial [Podila clonocystis]
VLSASAHILTVRTQTDHPVWTHIKNTAVNHELDSLRFIHDTIMDPTGSFTFEQRQVAIRDHIKKRAATIRIGGSKGWSAIPDSELQQDFKKLGLTDDAAAAAVSRQSFRTSPSAPRGYRKSRGPKPKKA